MAPSDCPHLLLQAMAGPLAAATASTVTNPMDVVRARVQVMPMHTLSKKTDSRLVCRKYSDVPRVRFHLETCI